MEQSANNLVAWQPGIDVAIADLTAKLGSIDEVKSQVGSLSTKLDHVVLDRHAAGSGILPNPVAAVASSPAGNPAVGPDGHHIDNHYREPGFESVTTISHLPVKGMPYDPPPLTFDSRPFSTYHF